MRRTPPSEKRARGTYRSERDRSLAPIDADILPPGYLTPAGLRVWRLKAPGLQAEGLLTPLDTENFALWCELQAGIEDGFRQGKLPNRDVMAQFRALSNSFGLTPDARSKLGHEVKPPVTEENPYAQLNTPPRHNR